MTCVHLQKLYKLCQEHDMKLGGTDLIRLVCRQCGAHEVCPSTLMDEDAAGATWLKGVDLTRERCSNEVPSDEVLSHEN